MHLLETKRFISIDLLRAVAIIAMVQIHMGMYLTKLVDKNLFIYKLMNYFGQFAAPMFLILVGIDIVLAGKSFKYFLERGVFLIVIGLIFINLWHADILHYIGIFMIVSFLLLKLNKFPRLVIASVFLFGASFILKYVNYLSGWERVAYRLKDFWTFPGFFNNLIANGFYPIFPWIFFTIFGTVIGEIILNSKKKTMFSVKSIVVGIILLGIGLYLRSFWELTFYPTSVSYVLVFSGVCLALFGLFFLLDAKRVDPWVLRPVVFFGTVAFSVYILHILALSYFFLTGNINTFSLGYVLSFIAVFVPFLGFVCYLFSRRLGHGPFEYLWHKLIGSFKGS